MASGGDVEILTWQTRYRASAVMGIQDPSASTEGDTGSQREEVRGFRDPVAGSGRRASPPIEVGPRFPLLPLCCGAVLFLRGGLAMEREENATGSCAYSLEWKDHSIALTNRRALGWCGYTGRSPPLGQ